MNLQRRSNWPRLLNGLLRQVLPAHRALFGKERLNYYRSADETELATDVMYRSPESLAALYPRLRHYAMTGFGSSDVLCFLGKRPRVAAFYEAEIHSHLGKRREGIREKPTLDGNSVKMYDKATSVLRVGDDRQQSPFHTTSAKNLAYLRRFGIVCQTQRTLRCRWPQPNNYPQMAQMFADEEESRRIPIIGGHLRNLWMSLSPVFRWLSCCRMCATKNLIRMRRSGLLAVQRTRRKRREDIVDSIASRASCSFMSREMWIRSHGTCSATHLRLRTLKFLVAASGRAGFPVVR